jgi:hypothetical protein
VSLSLSVNRAILLRYIFMLDIMYDFLLAHYFVKIIYILFQVTSLLYPATLPKHTHIPLSFFTSHLAQSHTHTPLFLYPATLSKHTHIPLCFCTKPPCPITHTYPFVSVPRHLAQYVCVLGQGGWVQKQGYVCVIGQGDWVQKQRGMCV